MTQVTENTAKSSLRHNFAAYLLSEVDGFARHSAKPLQSVTEISAKSALASVPETTFANVSANEEQITYPFSFPLCDLLICEFAAEDASVTNLYSITKATRHLNARTATTSPLFPVAVRGVVSVAEYILQKVIRRKLVPFFQSAKDQSYLGCYVIETLECGHEKTIHPSEVETLTARKRSCHECSGWMGGLQIGKRKAPASVKGIVRKRKDVGESPWWAIGFGIGCASLLIFVISAHWPKSYFYTYPTNYLRVIQRINDSDFMVQRVEAGLAQETTMMRFCTDAKLPWFEAGHILQWLRYNDVGSCQSLGPDDRGFDVVRDSKGLPVIAPNCHFDWSTPNGHVVGPDGKPCQPKFD